MVKWLSIRPVLVRTCVLFLALLTVTFFNLLVILSVQWVNGTAGIMKPWSVRVVKYTEILRTQSAEDLGLEFIGSWLVAQHTSLGYGYDLFQAG